MQKSTSVTIKNSYFQTNTWSKFVKGISEIEFVSVIESSSQIDIVERLTFIYNYIIKAMNKGNLKLRCFHLQCKSDKYLPFIDVKLKLHTADILAELPFHLGLSLTLKHGNISVQIVKALLPLIIVSQKMYSSVYIKHCSIEEEVLKELCDLFHNVSEFYINFDSINQFNQCLVDFWINIVQQFESGTRLVPAITLKCVNDDDIKSSFKWDDKLLNIDVKINTDKEFDEEFRMLTKVIPYVKSLKCNLGSRSTWDGISKEIMKAYVSNQLVLSSLQFQGMFDVLSPEFVSCVPYLTIFHANVDLDLITNISAALREEENQLKIEDLHLCIAEKQIRIRNHISDLIPCLPLLKNVSLNVKYDDETCEDESAQVNVKKNEDETCEDESAQANEMEGLRGICSVNLITAYDSFCNLSKENNLDSLKLEMCYDDLERFTWNKGALKFQNIEFSMEVAGLLKFSHNVQIKKCSFKKGALSVFSEINRFVEIDLRICDDSVLADDLKSLSSHCTIHEEI